MLLRVVSLLKVVPRIQSNTPFAWLFIQLTRIRVDLCACARIANLSIRRQYQVELGNKYWDRWFPYVSRSFMKVQWKTEGS